MIIRVSWQRVFQQWLILRNRTAKRGWKSAGWQLWLETAYKNWKINIWPQPFNNIDYNPRWLNETLPAAPEWLHCSLNPQVLNRTKHTDDYFAILRTLIYNKTNACLVRVQSTNSGPTMAQDEETRSHQISNWPAHITIITTLQTPIHPENITTSTLSESSSLSGTSITHNKAGKWYLLN